MVNRWLVLVLWGLCPFVGWAGKTDTPNLAEIVKIDTQRNQLDEAVKAWGAALTAEEALDLLNRPQKMDALGTYAKLFLKQHKGYESLTFFEIGFALFKYAHRTWTKITQPNFSILIHYPSEALADHITKENTIEFSTDFLKKLFENRTTFIETSHDMGEKSIQEKNTFNQNMHNTISKDSQNFDACLKTIENALKKKIHDIQQTACQLLDSKMKYSLFEHEELSYIEGCSKHFWNTLSSFHQKFIPVTMIVSELSNNLKFFEQARLFIEESVKKLSIKLLNDSYVQRIIIKNLTEDGDVSSFYSTSMPKLQNFAKNPPQKAFQIFFKLTLQTLVRDIFEAEADRLQGMLDFAQRKNIDGWQSKEELKAKQNEIQKISKELIQKNGEVRSLRAQLKRARDEKKYMALENDYRENQNEVPAVESEQIQKNKKRPATTHLQDLEAEVKNSFS